MDEMEKVTSELEEEQGYWERDRLPHPSKMYRIGDGEFEHHCHMETLVRIMAEVLEVDKEQMELIYKQVVLTEMRTLRQVAKEVRSQAIRQNIVRGINPLNGENPRI